MGLISRVSSRTYRYILETTTMVLSITNKLQKKNNQRASDIESSVAQAILDIQNGADNATKEQLMQLHLVAVKEVDVGGRNALILMVPAPQVVGWQKKPEKPVPNATNKNDQSAEVSDTFMKLSWKIAFIQLKSPVNESDINSTIPPLSRLFLIEARKPPSSTKSLLSVLSTND